MPLAAHALALLHAEQQHLEHQGGAVGRQHNVEGRSTQDAARVAQDQRVVRPVPVDEVEEVRAGTQSRQQHIAEPLVVLQGGLCSGGGGSSSSGCGKEEQV